MNASVVIVTYDRQEDLVECVRSVLGGFEVPDEIIVVDDGDVERTARRLADHDLLDRVEHVEGPHAGLPASRNAGVELASGDVVCFVDDDVVVPPIWLREVMGTYERNPDATGVGGHVLNFNPERINKANVESFGYRALTAVRHLFAIEGVGVISPLGVLWAPHTFMRSGEQDVEAFQGCNMTFRRDALEEFRFDEWYGTTGSAACEELDLCTRVSAAGHRLVFNPRATVVHKRSPGATPRSEDPNYDNVTNLSYFVLNNPSFGYVNFVLFALAMTAYSLGKRDPAYVRHVGKGLLNYLRHAKGGRRRDR